MGMLSEYGPEWDDYQPLANARDEYLTRAYVDGRNAARDGRSRDDITDLYACDQLAAADWKLGYDDWTADQKGTNK